MTPLPPSRHTSRSRKRRHHVCELPAVSSKAIKLDLSSSAAWDSYLNVEIYQHAHYLISVLDVSLLSEVDVRYIYSNCACPSRSLFAHHGMRISLLSVCRLVFLLCSFLFFLFSLSPLLLSGRSVANLGLHTYAC